MQALKFRVLLDSNQNQEVFRDIVVDSQANFEVLYHAILQAFNFVGKEMGSFYVSNDDWDKGHEISWLDMSYDEHDPTHELPNVMAKANLHEFISEPDQKFILVYDFLRMWIFLIELIGTEEEVPSQPEVVLSVGEAPLEDSKPISEEVFGSDFEADDDDDFGFDDLEDGFDEEDYSNFDDFEI